MQIKVKKTHHDAVMPIRGSAGAAGFDLTAVSVKRAADLYIFDTGIALEIPEGYWGGIYARSSLFFTGLEKCGGVCVIDSDYRGSIFVVFREVPGDQNARRMAELTASLRETIEELRHLGMTEQQWSTLWKEEERND